MPVRPCLLVLNQYYWPRPEADGRLLTQLCEGLAREWDVTVVTGPADGVPGGADERHGVRILRVSSTAFARRRLSLRALNYATYFVGAGLQGLGASSPDVVLSYTNPPFVGDLAWALARRFRAPLVVAVQDVFPETAVAVGRVRNRLVLGTLGGAVAFFLRRADRVVAIGETMRARLVDKGVPPDRIRVIENWVDTDAIHPEPQDNDWAREHGFAGRFVVMHSGNVGHAQDLDTLIRASVDVDDVAFVIVGDGARLAEVQSLATSLDAPIRFLPFQPAEVLPQSLATASVHVVGLARGLAGFVVPSRLYGVLAAGRPVIAAAEDESETARLVSAVGCGVVVAPGDHAVLAAAIRAAHDGQYDLDGMGRRGRDYVVSEASRDGAVARYAALLEEVRASGS